MAVTSIGYRLALDKSSSQLLSTALWYLTERTCPWYKYHNRSVKEWHMAEDKAGKAPVYVSYLTFANLLDWLRELGTLPSQFDRSFWGSKYSGATGAQLMTGLRFLGLLDGDKPTDRLEQLALATEVDRKPMIADLLRDSYGTDLVDGLPKATPKMVRDALFERGATDGTFRKAQSFFINAAKAADLPMPVSIAKQARNKPPTVRRNGQVAKSRVQTKPKETLSNPEDKPLETVRHKLPADLHAALVPIVDDLPKVGPTWRREEHDRWLETFKAVLDYAYPVQEAPGEA